MRDKRGFLVTYNLGSAVFSPTERRQSRAGRPRRAAAEIRLRDTPTIWPYIFKPGLQKAVSGSGSVECHFVWVPGLYSSLSWREQGGRGLGTPCLKKFLKELNKVVEGS
jgi:hypothetical protein